MDNIINKRNLILKSLLRVLEAELFGLFVFLFFWATATAIGVAANIIFAVIGILMLVCVMADYGLKTGTMCHNKVNLHGAEPCRNLGYTMGLVAMCPSYIFLGILIISKGGAIGNFLPAYKLLNACFFPIIDLVAPTANIADVSPALYIIMAVVPLFYLFSLGMSFRWGYDSVDLKTKIMYRKK
ncbi:MAG: hypothetical protein K2F81_04530 [Ruminococcus sp.]|nr:hypothetical protein [Ruminococcus sp.]